MTKPVQGGIAAAVLVLIPVLAVAGSDAFRAALDFTTGVLSLVSLTASVAWGLLATDRLLLSVRHRLLAQAIHRTTAVASLGFLLLHATVKVSLGHVELIGALVPFSLGLTGASGLIGLGSLAGLLMVAAASTGAARSALAGRGTIAARWRPLHMLAYPAWCFALMHGLYAGRPAAAWVTALYCLALAGVAGAVSVRLLPRPVQGRLAERLLALLGPGAERNGSTPRRRRDPSLSPLPGTADLPPQTARSGASDRRGPAAPPTAGRSERPGEQPFPDGLGRPRERPSSLAPPLPAFPPVASVPEPSAPSAPWSGTGGAGISAGYRAVSRGGGTDVAAAVSPGPATQEIPVAERVLMTEELPVVTDAPAPRPGFWPTPSPPPPAPSPPSARTAAPPLSSYVPQQPSHSPYESYEPHVPHESFEAAEPVEPAGFSGPLASSPPQPAGAPPSYGFPYGDPGATGGSGPAGAAGRRHAAAGGATGGGSFPPGPDSFPPFPPFAAPAQDPFQQPPAGEPWTAPAGERP
ncbi:hypothetical protein [Streptomyces sp. ODS05-4]|uniref:hypothetical protein n=1 Tax=Streptomyces sp. ODS05-4 TaxID=2944939 RepID=UPI0027E4F0D1|nr:hypothetical protein [Streptomyces sp. ODS05-4]